MNINFGVVAGQKNPINPSKENNCGGSRSNSHSHDHSHSHDRH